MSYDGVVVGVVTLALFSVSRWLCIAGEYYFTRRIWVVFLAIGLLSLWCSLRVTDLLFSSLLSVQGFCFLWGIREVIAQEGRVARGWYPRNPRRR